MSFTRDHIATRGLYAADPVRYALTVPELVLPKAENAVACILPTSAKWQDTIGTIPAESHLDPVVRVDNDGVLGGFFLRNNANNTIRLDLTTFGSPWIEFTAGNNNLVLPDDDRLTPVSGQGFTVLALASWTNSKTNVGLLGKWSTTTPPKTPTSPP